MFRLSRVLCSYFSPPYKSFKETLIFFLLPWHVYCCSSLMEEEPSGQGFENNPCSHVHDPSSPLSRFPFSIVSLSLFSPYSLILCFLHRVQFSSVAQSGLTLCDPMDCSTPSFPVHHQLPELAQIHVHQVGDAIQPSHPLSSPSPSAFSLSHIRVFSNELALCIRWPEYWSFIFSISPSNEYSGLISFRIDLLHLLEVQGTLKSLFQPHSSKTSILQHSAFLWSNSHIHTWLLEKP